MIFNWIAISKYLWAISQNLSNSMAIELLRLHCSYIQYVSQWFSLKLTNGVPEGPPPQKISDQCRWQEGQEFLLPLESDRDCPSQLLNNHILELPDVASINYLLFIWNLHLTGHLLFPLATLFQFFIWERSQTVGTFTVIFLHGLISLRSQNSTCWGEGALSLFQPVKSWGTRTYELSKVRRLVTNKSE